MSDNAKSKSTDVVGRIIELLEDPSEVWFDLIYTIHHKRTGIEIWTSNVPVLDTNTYPNRLCIGLINKWRIWMSVRVAKRNILLRILEAKYRNETATEGED